MQGPFGMVLQGQPPFTTSNGLASHMTDASMAGFGLPFLGHQFSPSPLDMSMLGMMGMPYPYPGLNLGNAGMINQEMANLQVQTHQQMQHYLALQQHQLQQMFPSTLMGMPGFNYDNLGHQTTPPEQQQQTQQLTADNLTAVSGDPSSTNGSFPCLPSGSDPEALRQAVAAFAAGVDAVLPGMGMAAAGQMLPSIANGIPPVALPGMLPPFGGLFPSLIPPTIPGFLPPSMPLPHLGATIHPPQLFPSAVSSAAAAAKAASVVLQPSLLAALPGGIPPGLFGLGGLAEDPVEKLLKRKQSNRESARRSRIISPPPVNLLHRDSARRSRIRKQAEADGIEEEVEYLMQRKASLQSRLDRLEKAAVAFEDHNKKLQKSLDSFGRLANSAGLADQRQKLLASKAAAEANSLQLDLDLENDLSDGEGDFSDDGGGGDGGGGSGSCSDSENGGKDHLGKDAPKPPQGKDVHDTDAPKPSQDRPLIASVSGNERVCERQITRQPLEHTQQPTMLLALDLSKPVKEDIVPVMSSTPAIKPTLLPHSPRAHHGNGLPARAPKKVLVYAANQSHLMHTAEPSVTDSAANQQGTNSFLQHYIPSSSTTSEDSASEMGGKSTASDLNADNAAVDADGVSTIAAVPTHGEAWQTMLVGDVPHLAETAPIVAAVL